MHMGSVTDHRINDTALFGYKLLTICSYQLIKLVTDRTMSFAVAVISLLLVGCSTVTIKTPGCIGVLVAAALDILLVYSTGVHTS